jgi:hypothetical protein
MVYVQVHRARLDDEPGLLRLLAATCHPLSVRSMLSKPFFGRRWQQRESRDCWLASDGKKVLCMNIRGASSAQIAAIRLRFDHLASRRARVDLSPQLLCELVASVTGECRCL